jgi:hypothetical protein
MSPFFALHPFVNDSDTIFLGTVKNPSTGMVYDLYTYRTRRERESYAAVHSNEGVDYGSCEISDIDMTKIILQKDTKILQDYTFGMFCAYVAAVAYWQNK